MVDGITVDPLGTGDLQGRSSQVDLPVKFISLSAGYDNHSLGISEIDRALWSWGSNKVGQIGQGNDTCSSGSKFSWIL